MTDINETSMPVLYKPRVLLIGAGLTSSLLTLLIRRNEKLAQMLDLYVWEKSDTVGGRFMSYSGPGTSATGYVDLGAQYLTQSQGHISKKYYDELLQAGLLREMNTCCIPGFRQDDTKINYACTQGTASVVKYLFDQTKLSSIKRIVFNKNVTQIHEVDLFGIPKLQVWNNEDERELFDVVISTIPVPQFMELGNISNILKENPTVDTAIRQVQYSSRYAVALFYTRSNPLEYDDNAQALNFISNPNSPVRYWAIENLKRSGPGLEPTDSPESIVVHMAAGFTGNTALTSHDFDIHMRKIIAEEIKYPLPDFPFFKTHYWKYSQVSTPYPGKPGYIKLSNSPLLIATGDGFSGSGFEGCVNAAESAFNFLISKSEELRKIEGAGTGQEDVYEEN